ncbi:hypothetical protein CLF_104165 [Clonorchis sinensis]|uniref:Uncharacterized protein n=1 Tax=Clonorchis sinensis TaxID=79923 RepID=G7YB46_CLOSI|nr:hypothetical protein CLF_104165 [Clonorchis sinensis]
MQASWFSLNLIYPNFHVTPLLLFLGQRLYLNIIPISISSLISNDIYTPDYRILWSERSLQKANKDPRLHVDLPVAVSTAVSIECQLRSYQAVKPHRLAAYCEDFNVHNTDCSAHPRLSDVYLESSSSRDLTQKMLWRGHPVYGTVWLPESRGNVPAGLEHSSTRRITKRLVKLRARADRDGWPTWKAKRIEEAYNFWNAERSFQLIRTSDPKNCPRSKLPNIK